MIASLLPDLPKAKFSLALLFVVGTVGLISAGSLFVDSTPLQLVDHWLRLLGIEKSWPLDAERWMQERSTGCTRVATGALALGLGFTIYQADPDLDVASNRAPMTVIVAASALVQLESGWSDPVIWALSAVGIGLLIVGLGEKSILVREASSKAASDLFVHLAAPLFMIVDLFFGPSRSSKSD